MTNLTQKQKDIIIDHNLSKTLNIGFPQNEMGMYANFYELFLKDGRFPTFSAMVREAMKCLLYHGLDWRDKNNRNDDSIMLRKILLKLDNLGEVKPRKASDNDNQTLDDTEGFFSDG